MNKPSRTKGYEGKKIAKLYFESLGFSPVKTKKYEAYDFSVNINNKVYGVAVKYGKKFMLDTERLDQIMEEMLIPALFIIKDNKQFAFLINDTKILEKGDTNGE